VKATDVDSGKEIHGLTTDLSEGGCCMLTRKAPFSQGTRIMLEITKNGVSFLTHATVVYNLKDQFMGLRFEEMSPDQAAIVAEWLKGAVPSTRHPDPVGT
jgi:c-di-GMP-binding flagellar brake protein YcgR